MSKVQKELETELRDRLITNYQEAIPTHNEFLDIWHVVNFYDHKRRIIFRTIRLPEKEQKSSFKNIRIEKKNQISGKFEFSGIAFREDFYQSCYDEDEGHLLFISKGEVKKISVYTISEKPKKIQEIDFEQLDVKYTLEYCNQLKAFRFGGKYQSFYIIKYSSKNKKYEVLQNAKPKQIKDKYIASQPNSETLVFVNDDSDIEIWALDPTSNKFLYSWHQESKDQKEEFNINYNLFLFEKNCIILSIIDQIKMVSYKLNHKLKSLEICSTIELPKKAYSVEEIRNSEMKAVFCYDNSMVILKPTDNIGGYEVCCEYSNFDDTFVGNLLFFENHLYVPMEKGSIIRLAFEPKPDLNNLRIGRSYPINKKASIVKILEQVSRERSFQILQNNENGAQHIEITQRKILKKDEKNKILKIDDDGESSSRIKNIFISSMSTCQTRLFVEYGKSMLLVFEESKTEENEFLQTDKIELGTHSGLEQLQEKNILLYYQENSVKMLQYENNQKIQKTIFNSEYEIAGNNNIFIDSETGTLTAKVWLNNESENGERKVILIFAYLDLLTFTY